jgi:alkylhydroperoxidase family enzyme
MQDRYRELRERLEAIVGPLDVPPEAAAYVAKVKAHAYKVTDEDVAALKAAGWTDDRIFELTVAAALSAARERLMAGLFALEGSHAARKTG